MPPKDDASARQRILDAAIAEFADVGLAGARVDRIAERAGANKQLIYYYFRDKDGLFDEAIRSMAKRFTEVRSTLPPAPADRPAAYFLAAAQDVSIVRMLEWESLTVGEAVTVDEDARAAHARSGVAGLRAEQRAGVIPADHDPAQLFLTLQALSAHPFAFTQMTRYITGRNASDPVFQRERVKHLKNVGRRLFSGSVS
jgi:TetR/AcrR family transcriptional regulator